MVDLSLPEELKIKSNINDYPVFLVEDFALPLAEESEANSFFIIDQNVFNLYGEKIRGITSKSRHIVIEATEAHKSFDYIHVVINSLLENNIKRNTRLIAIGGGIIQDITGFIASILFRGVEWVFYPTTLLAQSDSCIGSKTSINFDDYKNQLGTFYPPRRIILDVNFLKTLKTDDIKSGLGEIIKVHLLDGEQSLEYLASNYERSFSDSAIMKDLIYRSLMIKKRVIEKDEFDKDYRNIMNYGHTFGHAIESMSNYEVSHGQAVTLGMDVANYVSHKIGMLSDEDFKNMREIVLKNFPDYHLQLDHMDSFMAALARDKKNVDESLMAILTKGPGKMLKTKIPIKNLRGFLNCYLADSAR